MTGERPTYRHVLAPPRNEVSSGKAKQMRAVLAAAALIAGSGLNLLGRAVSRNPLPKHWRGAEVLYAGRDPMRVERTAIENRARELRAHNREWNRTHAQGPRMTTKIKRLRGRIQYELSGASAAEIKTMLSREVAA